MIARASPLHRGESQHEVLGAGRLATTLGKHERLRDQVSEHRALRAVVVAQSLTLRSLGTLPPRGPRWHLRELGPDGLEADAELLENLGGDALGLEEQAEQEVLGAHLLVFFRGMRLQDLMR